LLTFALFGSIVCVGIVLNLTRNRIDEKEKYSRDNLDKLVQAVRLGDGLMKQLDEKNKRETEKQSVALVNDLASSAVSIWSLGAQSRCQQSIGVGPAPCVLAMLTTPLFRKTARELAYQKALIGIFLEGRKREEGPKKELKK
jgi:hypothetical protein